MYIVKTVNICDGWLSKILISKLIGINYQKIKKNKIFVT